MTMNFFLFSYDREINTFTGIIGPVLHNDIPSAKEMFFKDDPKVQVLEELAFASRFPDIHRSHVHYHWFDTLRCYAIANEDWLGKCHKSSEPLGLAGDFFHVYEVQMNGKRALRMNASVLANQFQTARLLHDLIALFPMFLIHEGYPYYRSQLDSQRLHLGVVAGGAEDVKSGAYQRFLAETTVKNACLT